MIVGRIDGATRELGKPAGWNDARDGKCLTLPVRDECVGGVHQMVSAWVPTPDEIARIAAGERANVTTLVDAIRDGAVQRVRPKAMTVAVILAGLLPILRGHGTGSEIMQRIAAPMVGGMISAPILSMLVIPALYRLLRGRKLAHLPETSGATNG